MSQLPKIRCTTRGLLIETKASVLLDSNWYVSEDFLKQHPDAYPPPISSTRRRTRVHGFRITLIMRYFELSKGHIRDEIVCGEPEISPKLPGQKILNGEEATPHSFPWQVNLLFSSFWKDKNSLKLAESTPKKLLNFLKQLMGLFQNFLRVTFTSISDSL